MTPAGTSNTPESSAVPSFGFRWSGIGWVAATPSSAIRRTLASSMERPAGLNTRTWTRNGEVTAPPTGLMRPTTTLPLFAEASPWTLPPGNRGPTGTPRDQFPQPSLLNTR